MRSLKTLPLILFDRNLSYTIEVIDYNYITYCSQENGVLYVILRSTMLFFLFYGSLLHIQQKKKKNKWQRNILYIILKGTSLIRKPNVDISSVKSFEKNDRQNFKVFCTLFINAEQTGPQDGVEKSLIYGPQRDDEPLL